MAKGWKQPRCPQVGEGAKRDPAIQWNIIQSSKKRILTHAVTWMKLEGILLSEISWSQKNSTVPFHFYEVPTVISFLERE